MNDINKHLFASDLLSLMPKTAWTRREFVVSTLATGFALWLFAFPLAAFAQQPATVGELLDEGGKKLTKDDLSKLLTGATVSGIQVSGLLCLQFWTAVSNWGLSCWNV